VKHLFCSLAVCTLITPVVSAQQPVPFLHPNDIVLFQGDSITDGGKQRTGSDYNHIMGKDYAYILAAEIGANYPTLNVTFINRGIGSQRVPDFVPRWQTDVRDIKPNLLSILVGINDTLMTGDRQETPDQYETTYDTLLRQTIAARSQNHPWRAIPPAGRQIQRELRRATCRGQKATGGSSETGCKVPPAVDRIPRGL
jgi:lysophospholipase L1-like esterase